MALLIAAAVFILPDIGAAQSPAPVAHSVVIAEASADSASAKDAGHAAQDAGKANGADAPKDDKAKGADRTGNVALPAPASPTPADAPKKLASLAPAAPALKDTLKSAPLPHSAGRAHFRSIIEKETTRTGLPSEIAEAVMEVESGFNPAVIGAAGEIGLMQLMPPTARMLGFSGSLAELAQPEVNIHYGVNYLSQAWRLAGGDLCTAVMKYRAGHGETRFSQLSVNYCVAVRSRLAARGYHVSGVVPIATFGQASQMFTGAWTGGGAGGRAFGGPPRVSLRSGPPPCRSNCLAPLIGGRPNFDQINNSLNTLVLQSNLHAVRLR